MRAVQFSRYGGPEVLELVEVPDPHAGQGEIRVAVGAVGINPVDYKQRTGAMGGELPRFTGREVAGVVDELGEGVTGVGLGDRVFGPVASGGGAAEYALLRHWAPIPASLDLATAAGLPIAVETATRCLELLHVASGETLLINGASGAVGRVAVQLARERGARVIGTASEQNHDELRALGAEPTIYGPGLEERVRAITGDGVSAALDAAGGGALPDLVALAGGPDRVVTIADGAGAQQTGVRFTGGAGETRHWEALEPAARLIEAGRLSLPVARTFPLEQIAEAHRLSESGHPGGKLVVLVG